jgi:uncharacterized protein (TIGR02145 family)
MKNLIISLLMLFFVLNMNAQEPQIKIRLQGEVERTYRISDVEEMSFIKSEMFSYLSIYFSDSTKANIDTKSIEKMELSEENEILSVYTCGYPYSYDISTIDSIIFGYDIDGLYETITIGGQVWMQYNLDVCHYRNGDPIIHAQTNEEWGQAGEQGIGAWCYYDNDPENGKIYGKLYNFYAVNDPRGLAPEGWRVPSDDDFSILEDYVGFPAGSKLSGEYDLWADGSMRKRTEFNSSGFRATPSGYRYPYGIYEGYGEWAPWWTSTEGPPGDGIFRYIEYNDTILGYYSNSKNFGLSFRCIRE